MVTFGLGSLLRLQREDDHQSSHDAQQTFSSVQFLALSHTSAARARWVKRRKKNPTWRQQQTPHPPKRQVSAPNLPFISVLLKVGSLKSSRSGSRTCKHLERVSHFSQRACSTVYPASPSRPLSHLLLTLPVFHARQWELVSPVKAFSLRTSWASRLIGCSEQEEAATR